MRCQKCGSFEWIRRPDGSISRYRPAKGKTFLCSKCTMAVLGIPETKKEVVKNGTKRKRKLKKKATVSSYDGAEQIKKFRKRKAVQKEDCPIRKLKKSAVKIVTKKAVPKKKKGGLKRCRVTK